MAFIRQNDLHFAYMALTLVAGLSGNDRRVAGAILDHFNKKTGQCDPSGAGLAALLDINRKTVIDATARLCGEFEFFRRSVTAVIATAQATLRNGINSAKSLRIGTRREGLEGSTQLR